MCLYQPSSYPLCGHVTAHGKVTVLEVVSTSFSIRRSFHRAERFGIGDGNTDIQSGAFNFDGMPADHRDCVSIVGAFEFNIGMASGAINSVVRASG